MGISNGDRVVLTRNGKRMPGTVHGAPTETHAFVRLDGGTQCSFPLAELEVAAAEAAA